MIDDGDSFLIVMDYIQGKSLDKILKGSMEKEGLPIALDDVIAWGKQLCEVFYYLHTRPNPIIYRDMKPGNVMLKPDGEISLIDFGTARTFKQGNREDTTCLGTPGYASPEQYGGNGQSTPRSDIYCLGATLHHLITGRNPSPAPFNFPKITQCRPSLVDEIPREDMNKLLGLEMIIDRCTQYEPENRYESCLEMLYDLEYIEELSLPYRKKLRNKLLGFGVSAAVAVLCGGISLGCMLMENKTEQSGYDYYVDQAEKSDGTAKVNYAKKQLPSTRARKRPIWFIWMPCETMKTVSPVRIVRILRPCCSRWQEDRPTKKYWKIIWTVTPSWLMSWEWLTTSRAAPENRQEIKNLQKMVRYRSTGCIIR